MASICGALARPSSGRRRLAFARARASARSRSASFSTRSARSRRRPGSRAAGRVPCARCGRPGSPSAAPGRTASDEKKTSKGRASLTTWSPPSLTRGWTPVLSRSGRSLKPRHYTRPQMGDWYSIGISSGLGAAIGVLPSRRCSPARCGRGRRLWSRIVQASRSALRRAVGRGRRRRRRRRVRRARRGAARCRGASPWRHARRDRGARRPRRARRRGARVRAGRSAIWRRSPCPLLGARLRRPRRRPPRRAALARRATEAQESSSSSSTA